MQDTPQVTPERVANAYDALASGERERIREFWADDMLWLVPGHNPLSGQKNGLDEFLAFMAEVGRLSGNSFRMDREAIMVGDNTSADVTHNLGTRAEDATRVLDIDVIHYLRWRDGKIIEGRGAIFGAERRNTTHSGPKAWLAAEDLGHERNRR